VAKQEALHNRLVVGSNPTGSKLPRAENREGKIVRTDPERQDRLNLLSSQAQGGLFVYRQCEPLTLITSPRQTVCEREALQTQGEGRLRRALKLSTIGSQSFEQYLTVFPGRLSTQPPSRWHKRKWECKMSSRGVGFLLHLLQDAFTLEVTHES
jgi:hypothetical protein